MTTIPLQKDLKTEQPKIKTLRYLIKDISGSTYRTDPNNIRDFAKSPHDTYYQCYENMSKNIKEVTNFLHLNSIYFFFKEKPRIFNPANIIYIEPQFEYEEEK